MLTVEAIIVLVVCMAVGYWVRSTGAKPVANAQTSPRVSKPQRSFLIVPDKNNLTAYIDRAVERSRNGQTNISVVRTSAGIELLTDYELKVRASEVVEVVFCTDEGFNFPQQAAA